MVSDDTPIERDAATLKRVASGERAAFEALHAEHHPRVVRLAMGIVLDRDEAMDVAQEVFIRLLDIAPRWQPRAKLSTWMHRTTLNVASSTRRKVVRWWQRRERTAPTATVSPERRSAVTQAVRRIEDDLALLSPTQRAAVTLHLDLGMAAREIADELGLTPNAARLALSKGLRKLREAWGEDIAVLGMKETMG